MGPRLHPAAVVLGVGLVVLILAGWGCSRIPPHLEPKDPESGFSASIVEAHFDALDPLDPRLPGSEADLDARAYVRRELSLAGARVEELEEGGRRHLVATIDGASTDRVLLVAAYPAGGSGAWVDDSGLVVLLELARAWGRAEPPYTLEFALAEVRPARVQGRVHPTGDEAWGPPISSARDARRQLAAAGASLARGIDAAGWIDRLRAVIVLDFPAREGLRIARDLRSQPAFRDVFWQTAEDLGLDSTFPVDEDWSSPDSLHLGFRDLSMDRVLALVDSAWASPPGTSKQTRSDGARADTLEPVGLVTQEALGRLMERFAKVDDFAR